MTTIETARLAFWRDVNAVLVANGHAEANFGEIRQAVAWGHWIPSVVAQFIVKRR
jgi:hypothetical protein